VAELVKGYDQKQCEILEHVPGDGGISPVSALDFIHRDDEPGPMQEYVNS
jgi:hypothetical protein